MKEKNPDANIYELSDDIGVETKELQAEALTVALDTQNPAMLADVLMVLALLRQAISDSRTKELADAAESLFPEFSYKEAAS